MLYNLHIYFSFDSIMLYNKKKLTSKECLEIKDLNAILILARNCIVILKLQKYNSIKKKSGGGNICNTIFLT